MLESDLRIDCLIGFICQNNTAARECFRMFPTKESLILKCKRMGLNFRNSLVVIPEGIFGKRLSDYRDCAFVGVVGCG